MQVGINDITNDDSLEKVENLELNLEKIATKLENYGIKNVCLSGLVFTTRVHLSFLNQVNKCMLDICKAHNISLLEMICTTMDWLHLLRSGKFLLSNNFIENIN